MNRRILVLGGARSGKSRFAEDLARAHIGERVYIATAEALDEEMRSRILRHRKQRGNGWFTIEEPVALAEALRRECSEERFVLVDCLTLWISNLMHRESDVGAAVKQLCATISRLSGTLVIVSNEVGMGIVPDNELARRFRDEAGFANQAIAAACDEAWFMVAGLPVQLKG